MDLKSILKTLKLNESTISTILGGIVILVLGIFVINYFKKLPSSNQLPPALTTENTQGLITTHKVEKGETLSQIALKYYKSGDWGKIAEVNNVSNPNVIEVGQELKIPQETQTPTPAPQVAEAEVATGTETPQPLATQTPTPEETNPNEAISQATYKVVKGDSLWKIAVRAYGDGYKWVQIAKENKLKNPNLIHPGNVFILPR